MTVSTNAALRRRVETRVSLDEGWYADRIGCSPSPAAFASQHVSGLMTKSSFAESLERRRRITQIGRLDPNGRSSPFAAFSVSPFPDGRGKGPFASQRKRPPPGIPDGGLFFVSAERV